MGENSVIFSFTDGILLVPFKLSGNTSCMLPGYVQKGSVLPFGDLNKIGLDSPIFAEIHATYEYEIKFIATYKLLILRCHHQISTLWKFEQFHKCYK